MAAPRESGRATCSAPRQSGRRSAASGLRELRRQQREERRPRARQQRRDWLEPVPDRDARERHPERPASRLKPLQDFVSDRVEAVHAILLARSLALRE